MASSRAGFLEGPRYFKGNLHGHSTLSDGKLEPDSVIQLYRDRGYDFFALSDHERFFDSTQFDGPGFLVYPAIEFGVSEPREHKGHHLQGILGTGERAAAAGDRRLRHGQVLQRFPWRGPHTVQRAVDFLRDAGLMVMYNHLVWSRLELSDLLNVTGVFAVEVYNHGSEVGEAAGVSTCLWDLLLRRGRRVYGVASDDNHNGAALDSPYSDSFGGWIAVDAGRLTREALAAALSTGNFYSSTGPEVRAYRVDGDQVVVECSPVRSIRFISYERRGSVAFAEGGVPLTGARHTLQGDELFVRVECVDEAGRVAWTNPVFLEDLA